MAAGRFDALRDDLRAALRAVPADQRAGLTIEAAVLDDLTADVRAAIGAAGDGEGCGPGAAMADDEAEWLGGFWLAVAAGEVTAQAGS